MQGQPEKVVNVCETALIAVGANLPRPGVSLAETVTSAIAAVAQKAEGYQKVSRLYRTPCFPVGAGPDYVNAAFSLRYSGAADDLILMLHEIERDYNRERTKRWGNRTLDLDLIAFGNRVSPDEATFRFWHGLKPEQQTIRAPDSLILPHPRMQDRAFVLVPLADVAPDWQHPVLGLTVLQMLSTLPENDKKAIEPL